MMFHTQTVLEKLTRWISTYPNWENGVCVLSKGMVETSRREDIQGNALAGCRYYVTLFWEQICQDSQEKNAEVLLAFQQWVQAQSASGLAPKLGDMPAGEKIWTEKGGLTPGAQLVNYTVTLVADFMKVYEVK